MFFSLFSAFTNIFLQHAPLLYAFYYLIEKTLVVECNTSQSKRKIPDHARYKKRILRCDTSSFSIRKHANLLDCLRYLEEWIYGWMECLEVILHHLDFISSCSSRKRELLNDSVCIRKTIERKAKSKRHFPHLRLLLEVSAVH